MDKITFWRCRCGRSFFAAKPANHWSVSLDGHPLICRGPFQRWEAHPVSTSDLVEVDTTT